jgi:RimJ/RimL family protein N-acetyltransferase
MKSPVLIGTRLKLRPIEDEDKPVLVYKNRDLEFLRMVGEDVSTTKQLTDSEFEDLKRNPLYWTITLNEKCIGASFLHSLDQRDKRAGYAIGIFQPEHWGHGFGEEATRLVLNYVFNELSLHRVSIRVLSYNARAIRCYKKCGFLIEGTQRESALVSGNWYDDILMGLLASEFATQQAH